MVKFTPKKRPRSQRIWSFQSRHAGDIDFIRIAADLSYAKPVALVRPTKSHRSKADDRVWLVIHHKMMTKVRLLWEAKNLVNEPYFAVKELVDFDHIAYPTRDGNAIVGRLALSQTGGIIKALREIKALPWPAGEDKLACRIEVSTPEV